MAVFPLVFQSKLIDVCLVPKKCSEFDSWKTSSPFEAICSCKYTQHLGLETTRKLVLFWQRNPVLFMSNVNLKHLNLCCKSIRCQCQGTVQSTFSREQNIEKQHESVEKNLVLLREKTRIQVLFN